MGEGKLIQPGGEFSLGKKGSCEYECLATLAVQEVAGATHFSPATPRELRWDQEVGGLSGYQSKPSPSRQCREGAGQARVEQLQLRPSSSWEQEGPSSCRGAVGRYGRDQGSFPLPGTLASFPRVSMDVNLSKLQKTVEDRGVWCAVVHGVAESDMTLCTPFHSCLVNGLLNFVDGIPLPYINFVKLCLLPSDQLTGMGTEYLQAASPVVRTTTPQRHQ